MPSLVLTIEKSKHGIIVGPSGSNVNQIKKDCGTGFVIEIPRIDDASDEIKLTGTQQQIEIAKLAIDSLINPISKQSRLISEDIEIPKDIHWVVIGEKGATIQKIQAKTSAKVFFPKIDESSNVITIRGDTKEQVQKTKMEIEKVVNEYQMKAQQSDELYAKYRKQSQIHAENRNKYFTQSKEAYNKGDKALAKELSNKGKHEHHKMLKAQNHAAFKIFKSKYVVFK